jgi:hypothetical protein
MGDVAARPVVGAADADDGLERLLRGCAARDAQARWELEALYGPRLRSMLARRIRRPELVEPAMQAALDEICARAGEHDPEHESAEDWLFGRVRALAAGQGIADMAAARGAWVTAEPRHAEVARDDDEEALTEAPARERPRKGRRLAIAMACITVAALGTIAGGLWSSQRADPVQEIAPIPLPEAAPPPAPAPVAEPVPELPPVETVPSPAESPGEPTWWDLPTTDPVPAEPPRAPVVPEEVPQASVSADEKPAATVPGGAPRVFIHFTAGSADAAALARRLSERLPREGFAVAGLRPVNFRIGSGGVRYFFAQDREQARRLLSAGMRALGRGASPLPRGAADFSHYAPKPQPGTIEIWLSTR